MSMLYRTIRVIAGSAMLVLAFVSCQKNELGKSAESIKKLKTDFYKMSVNGSVGFDDFIMKGGASSADEVSDYLSAYLSAGPFGKLSTKVTPEGFACSALKVKNDAGGYLVGRNFDWENCTSIIIRNIPESGYASLSTVNLDFLGFGAKYKPEGMVNAFKATAGVYVPLDGINEKGLVVADLMAGDDEVTDQKTDKPDLTTTTAIRLLLNTAADVADALRTLGDYDMHSDIGSAHHLFIADASGRSVAVEWVDGEMIVTESDVLNNHYLCEEKAGAVQDETSFRHEASLLQARDAHNGVMSSETMADTMFDVLSLPDGSYYGGTQWTIIYDTKTASATWYLRRDRAISYTYFAGSDAEVVK